MIHVYGNTTAKSLQNKIKSYLMERNCEAVRKATVGVIDKSVDDDTFELMFIYTFLPYWCNDRIKQVKCDIDENFNIR